MILEVRDGMKVSGGFRQVQGVAPMAGSLGDAHCGGAHGAERLVGGVDHHRVCVDTAGRFEFHKIGFEQDAASPDVAQMLYQQAAHGVVDGLVISRHFADGNARHRNAAQLGSAP